MEIKDMWRRFTVLKQENFEKFGDLCYEKKLTKEDILLIVSTIKLNENFCQE